MVLESIIVAPEKGVTYYYGRCPNPGKLAKFHSGHEVVPYIRDDSILVIRTHCGNQIFQENEGQRPPEFDTEELCKTCHRSYAWEEMQKALSHRRQVEDEVAVQLDELAVRIEDNDINTIGVVREVRNLAESLRHKIQPLPKGDEQADRGNLRLMPGSSRG